MSKIRKIVLIGGAGTSRDVLALITSINKITPSYEILGVLDDNLPMGTYRYGALSLGPIAKWTSFNNISFIDCLGSPKSYRNRQKLLDDHHLNKIEFETLIHPSAMIADDVNIGSGSIIYPNVVALSNVSIGKHVTILSGTVLNHDVKVGNWSILASGIMIAGEVKVGDTCYLGASCSIREGINIGNGSLVGMGSAVIRDVKENTVVTGVPANFLRNAV